MGLFRDIGRRVERFKSEVESVADEQASHGCSACGERFYTDHEACPECGADAVEPLDSAESAPDEADDPAVDRVDSDTGTDAEPTSDEDRTDASSE